MPRRYPLEFRHKVLDLLAAGRTVAQVAADLQISDQTIYNWREQELIDTGRKPGLTSTDSAELIAARRRMAELETELAVTRRANELLRQVVSPKACYAAVTTMAAQDLPIQVACRVMDVFALIDESEASHSGGRDHPGSPAGSRGGRASAPTPRWRQRLRPASCYAPP